ncbi:MAG TPA: M48 family metallopeptidase [Paracoccaceae bacterium]|nr:M48 family metallopeptidase [Paracoccaceae bacterium]
MLRLAFLLSAAALTLPAAAQAEANLSQATLSAQDLRLAGMAERILGANVRLCRQTMPLTGLILHSADQYGTAPTGAFANGPVEVAQVVAGSPADQAGIVVGMAILAIGNTPISSISPAPGYPLRDAVFEQIAAWPADRPAILTVSNGEGEIAVPIEAVPGCRALVEVLTDEASTAQSDGRVIQLSYDLVARLDDAGLAVVFAHELAHLVLEHRLRLSEAGVADGLAREFGRNRRLTRLAEVEADLLSVHLLANAGFDPSIAPVFWRSDAGRVLGAGAFRSRVYPGYAERARQTEEEIARYLSGYAALSGASHLLALRDLPFADPRQP